MKDQHIGASLKYERLKTLIIDSLRNGQFRPGDRLPSQNEMARMYGISSGTVREAVASLVQDGLLYRIQGKGTFVSDVKKEHKTIALIMPHLHIPGDTEYGIGYNIIAPIVSYIQDEAFRNGMDVLLYFDDDRVEKERENIQRTMDRHVDGIVIFYIGEGENDEYLRMVEESGIALVMIDRYIDSIEADHVGTDNFKGARMAVEAMQRKGFRDIYHVTNSSGCTSATNRTAGYISAMKAAGLDPKILPKWDPMPTNNGEEEKAYLVAKDAIESSSEALGFFVTNCLMAAGVARAINESRLNPDNYALAFFDDEYFEADEGITLIKVLQPFEAMARKSIHMLMEQMNRERPPLRVFLEPAIRINESLSTSRDKRREGVTRDLCPGMLNEQSIT